MRKLIIAAVLLAACKPAAPPPPGYSGPLPSSVGQSVVHALDGKSFTDAAGSFGGGAWQLQRGIVGPQGLFVVLKQGTRDVTLPMLTDGDVADLHARVTGQVHPGLTGATSAEYRKASSGGK